MNTRENRAEKKHTKRKRTSKIHQQKEAEAEVGKVCRSHRSRKRWKEKKV